MTTSTSIGYWWRFFVVLLLAIFLLGAVEGQDEIGAKPKECVEKYVRLFGGEKSISESSRLYIHLLLRADETEKAKSLLSSVMDSSVCTSDLKVKWVLLNARNSKQAWRECLRLADSHGSPSSSLQCIEFLEEGGRGQIAGRLAILGIEPYWMPALLGLFWKASAGGWLALGDAEHGGRLFDLVEAGSPLARKMLERMPVYPLIKDVSDDKERGRIALEHFEKHTSGKTWENQQPSRWKVEAALLYHSGLTEKAIEVYDSIVKNGEARGSTYYRLARLYESQGRQEDAEATIQAGLKKFPEKNSILLVTAAEYAVKRGEVDEAISLLNKCLAASPEYPPAHILLAELQAQKGNRDAAIKACADTLAFSYGWDGDFLDRVNGVLETLVRQKENTQE